MFTALKVFASDLLSSIVFVVVYALTGNVPLVICVSIGVGIAQVAIEKLRGRPVSTMQWASMGLVVVFGGASLLTNDNRFIIIKHSIVSFAIGTVMLQKGWLDRYLPQVAHDNLPRGLIVGGGYAWAALLFALGTANYIVGTRYSFAVWTWYNSVVPLTAELTGFFLLFAIFRTVGILRRRRMAAA